LVELGEVIVGRHVGRASADQITLFESQGMAIQDLAVALRVLVAAEAKGLGQTIPME
jgi:ornithine cyclodeaminase